MLAMCVALGVLAADSGEVRIGNNLITDDVHRTTGYMPEEPLYPHEQNNKTCGRTIMTRLIDTLEQCSKTKLKELHQLGNTMTKHKTNPPRKPKNCPQLKSGYHAHLLY